MMSRVRTPQPIHGCWDIHSFGRRASAGFLPQFFEKSWVRARHPPPDNSSSCKRPACRHQPQTGVRLDPAALPAGGALIHPHPHCPVRPAGPATPGFGGVRTLTDGSPRFFFFFPFLCAKFILPRRAVVRRQCNQVNQILLLFRVSRIDGARSPARKQRFFRWWRRTRIECHGPCRRSRRAQAPSPRPKLLGPTLSRLTHLVAEVNSANGPALRRARNRAPQVSLPNLLPGFPSGQVPSYDAQRLPQLRGAPAL